MDNREYIFRVLNDVTKLPFLAEAMLIIRYSLGSENMRPLFLSLSGPQLKYL